MLILLFYFNNISSRLSEKKIVKGTPRIERLIQLVDNENKEIYILGDLNINLLVQNVSIAKKLQEIMELYQLTQIINDPTRITEFTKSLLDVCITSSPEKIVSSGVIHLGISDHSLIINKNKGKRSYARELTAWYHVYTLLMWA